MKNKTAALITLGCPKNLVDSESILALLGQKEYILTDSFEDADILIVNTCGFIKAAVDESISVINNLCKKKRKGQKIIVYGCLVNRFGKNFPSIKGVDTLVEGADPLKLLNTIDKERKQRFVPGDCAAITNHPRLISTYPYAYIKISDGCDNFCSYCLIPNIRGHLRSRSIKEIEEEAQCLEAMEIKELILIAQDTGVYGKDLSVNHTLDTLLSKLCKYNLHWLRIMYMHPAHLTEKTLEAISANRKICRYLDIPLQHIHPEILKKMNRPVINYDKLIDRIRKALPDIRLRTTFIVGSPGEQETHFKMLTDFVKEKKFDRLGVFQYSRERGTPAYELPGQVNKSVKTERERIVMELQRKISRKKLKRLVGNSLNVLIDGQDGLLFTGRTEFDAPEIDGTVYVKTREPLKAGNICTVKITSSDDYDLYGTLTKDKK
ncbi:MAG: 30S ribosomal protein S12 methylthiotransferase RimO [Candidatus Ratteibacteria bacterium]